MSNKERFKNIMDKDLNKNTNYNIIKSKMSNKNRTNKYFKYSLGTICLILVLFTIIILDKNSTLNIKKVAPTIENISNINIEETDSLDLELKEYDIKVAKYDAKAVHYLYIPYFEMLKDLNIPSDFDNEEFLKIFTKNDNNEYNVLHNYEFHYKNTKNKREIVIYFSDEYEPFTCYTIDKTTNKLQINNTNLFINKSNNIYMTYFEYKNYNFVIETTDITGNELIDLLKSIIK